MNRQMIDHRGPEFAAILAEITAGAKRGFKTKNDLLLLTSSGTGGLESAVANLVSPGDEGVVALCGNFGERVAALAAAYRAEDVRLAFEWGRPAGPDAVPPGGPGRLRPAGRPPVGGGGRACPRRRAACAACPRGAGRPPGPRLPPFPPGGLSLEPRDAPPPAAGPRRGRDAQAARHEVRG